MSFPLFTSDYAPDKPICPYGSGCYRTHNLDHMDAYLHIGEGIKQELEQEQEDKEQHHHKLRRSRRVSFPNPRHGTGTGTSSSSNSRSRLTARARAGPLVKQKEDENEEQGDHNQYKAHQLSTGRGRGQGRGRGRRGAKRKREEQEQEQQEEEEEEEEEENSSNKKSSANKNSKMYSAKKSEGDGTPIVINRAPVLALWATLVAMRVHGISFAEAATMGKAITGMFAQAKGRSLGLFESKPRKTPAQRAKVLGQHHMMNVMGRHIPCRDTEKGTLALTKGQPISGESATTYLKRAFGDNLSRVRAAMETLIAAYGDDVDELDRKAYDDYIQFRPGSGAWGAKGTLDLVTIEEMAKTRQP